MEPGTAQTRVLGSRFVARAFSCSDESQLTIELDALRKQHHDASHHCWAVVLRGETELIEKSNDAGEPKGTAGLPILKEIRGRNLESCAVIVTRWFGGTKLGTGGLVKAYAECAALALDASARRLRKTGVRVEVRAPYDLQALVFHLASKRHAPVEMSAEGSGVRFEIRLSDSALEHFEEELRELSAGKLRSTAAGRWIS